MCGVTDRVTLYCGAGELGYRALLGRIALKCDHLRGRHLLCVIHLVDAPFLSVRERVNTSKVLLVCRDSWTVAGSLGLLKRALRSSEFRRLEALSFRRRIHSSGSKIT